MADEPTNITPSVDPQAAVDAALTTPEPIGVPPVQEIKQDESVPEEMLVAAPPVAAPTPEPIVVTPMEKMADDTPLAFAGASSAEVVPPTPNSSDVPPLPTADKTEPKLPEPAYVPPAGNGAAEPVTVVEKPKKKGKLLKTLVAGVFLLFAAAVAGIYGYAYITKTTPMVAILLDGECTPGESQSRSCTTDGCAGKQYRPCTSSQTWGSWGSCEKTNSSCGATECSGTAVTSCNTKIGGVTCPGTKKCTPKQVWGDCVSSDPKCGQPTTTVPKVSCTKCTPSSGLCIDEAGLTPGVSCDASLNICDKGTNKGCTAVSNGPQCSDTKPCTNGGVCDNTGMCVDPGGPRGCGYVDSDTCKANSGQPVTEPGSKAYCDEKGHWCSSTRNECMFGESPNRTWCFMSLDVYCSDTVSDKCVSKPSPTPSPKPSPTPSPTPSPIPSPSPVIACTGLTKDKVDSAITKGSVVNFTCGGTVTPTGAVNLSYQFRIRKDLGAWVTLSATGNKASYTIPDYGDYDAQCRTCGQINNASKCDPVWQGAT